MKLSHAEIVEEYKGDSPFTLYVLGEYHHKKDVQIEVYQTLEELKSQTGITVLLLENFPFGEIEWSSRFYPITSLEDLTKLYGDISIDLEGAYSKWTRGAPTFGNVYQHEIKTYGVETIRSASKEHLRGIDKRCEELSLKRYHEGEDSLTKEEQEEIGWMELFVQKVIVKDASKDIVDNSLVILERKKENGGIFVIGDAHRETVTEYLKDKGVSYTYIQPLSFTNYKVVIPFYLIEKKQKQKKFKRPPKKRKK